MPIISDNTWFCLARKWSSHTAWVCPVPPAQQTLDNIPYVAVTFGIVRMLSKRITWLKSILKYWNSIRLPFAPTKSINLPCARAPGLEETWSMPTSWRRPHLQCPFPEKGGELFQPGFFNFSPDRKDRRNEWKKRWASHEAGSSTPIWVHLMFLL